MKPILRKTAYCLPIVLIILLTVFITSSATSAASVKAPALKAPVNTSSGVKVSWSKVPGVAKYRVFVKTKASPTWKKLADTTAATYLHKSATGGVTYTYTVRCLAKDGRHFTGGYNHNGRKVTYIKTPKLNSFQNTARGAILSWDKCVGAKKYRIYINTSKGWKTLATVTGTNYLHVDAKSGTTYSYKLQCLNQYNRGVSAVSGIYKHAYLSNAKPGVYTNVMFAADVYRSVGKVTKIPSKPNAAVNRKTAAGILCAALGYKSRSSLVSLIDTQDAAMKTVTFYGYFYPDNDMKILPAKLVTGNEYYSILAQLKLYKKLCGKRALLFGDSIMYGYGNSAYGDGRMLAEKYGMSYSVYAYSGATFSTTENGRGHIVDKIKEAAKAGCKADVIFLNGGTNDIKLIAQKSTTDTFDTAHPDKSAFTKGFHGAMNLISRNWKGVPVIYVRAHNISSCPNELEIPMGEYGLKIALFHGAYTVDIFSDTDFNTSDTEMRDRYTMYLSNLGRGDGTHPTYLGYTTYYLPLEAKLLSSITI